MKKSNKVLFYTLGIYCGLVILAALSYRIFSAGGGEFKISESKSYTFSEKTTQTHLSVPSFHRIEDQGGFDILLKQNASHDIEISADEQDIPNIVIQSKNGVLSLSSKNTLIHKVKVIIPVQEIDDILMNGNSHLSTEPLNEGHVNVLINGKGTALFQGNIQTLSVMLNGKSSLESKDIHAKNIEVESNGNGKIHLSGKTDHLSLTIRGHLFANTKDLAANAVSIVSEGNSSLIVQAIQSLDLNISGESDIEYSGNPLIKKAVTGNLRLHSKT